MKITKNIYLKNFNYQNSQKKKIIKLLKELIIEKNFVIKSMTNSYKNAYNKNFCQSIKKFEVN